jgi:predicted nuclease of predicted toxin-antitoxin system
LKILLDENLDWRLRRDLPEHTVESVPLLGWAGIENGALLRRAEQDQFDVLITMDSNLPYQQNLTKFQIAVVALRAPSNRLDDTRPLMVKVLEALPRIRPGTLTVIS